MRSVAALALAATLSTTNAAYQGFNYASTGPDGSIMELKDWKETFAAQAGLEGTNGAFTSARLYTMIVGLCPTRRTRLEANRLLLERSKGRGD